MNSVTLTTDIQLLVTDLANQLHVPEMEIMRQAIEAYAQKMRRKNRLLSFAGMLTETEADTLLDVIRANRVNKAVAFTLTRKNLKEVTV